MPMPTNIGVIDLMLAVPGEDNSNFLRVDKADAHG